MSAHVVVVGGGISGLTTARRLAQNPEIQVTLIESSDRLGGKIRTTEFGGRPVEEGADAFIIRLPWALELCQELGLAESLVHPATFSAKVYSKGKPRSLPQGLVMGVPPRIGPMMKSGLVSPVGLARAGLDFIKRDNWPGTEETIGQIVSRRLGPQVAANVVDPLLGGIYAADINRMSAAASFPQLDQAARGGRSLMLTLRKMQKKNPPDPTRPIFASLNGGLDELVQTLVARMIDGGAQIRMQTSVEHVERTSNGQLSVHLDGEVVTADHVVLATPAFISGRILAGEIEKRLCAIEYSSVVLATMDLQTNSTSELEGSGLLVAKPDQKLITAISYGSNKWPAWSKNGNATLRVSAGHIGNSDAMDMTDIEIEQAFNTELDRLIGLTKTPSETRVSRWQNAFPQYDLGHQQLISSIRDDLGSQTPGVTLTGAAYKGIGIPACIRQAEQCAKDVAESLVK